jgi:lipopolysaccharide biosynthesis regulator YciM
MTHHVEYGDFETFVQNEYNAPGYEFLSNEECSNDTAMQFYNVVIQTPGVISAARLNDFRAARGNRQYMAAELMQDMVSRQVIPEGTYVINISW